VVYMTEQTRDDHYAFLGLHAGASQAELERAVRQAAQHADTLAYASHADSAHAWARIRQVKMDLLSSPERRHAYDRSLVYVPPSRHVFLSTVEGSSAMRQPARAVPVDVAPSFQPSSHRAPWVLQALITGTLAVALTAVGLALVLDKSHSPLHGIPRATGLGISGPHIGNAFASGHDVTLQWHDVAGASLYHLEFATLPLRGANSDIAGRLIHTVNVHGTEFVLHLHGQQQYGWRIAALVHDRWSTFTPWHSFKTALPPLPPLVAERPFHAAPHMLAVNQHKHAQRRVRRHVGHRASHHVRSVRRVTHSARKSAPHTASLAVAQAPVRTSSPSGASTRVTLVNVSYRPRAQAVRARTGSAPYRVAVVAHSAVPARRSTVIASQRSASTGSRSSASTTTRSHVGTGSGTVAGNHAGTGSGTVTGNHSGTGSGTVTRHRRTPVPPPPPPVPAAPTIPVIVAAPVHSAPAGASVPVTNTVITPVVTKRRQPGSATYVVPVRAPASPTVPVAGPVTSPPVRTSPAPVVIPPVTVPATNPPVTGSASNAAGTHGEKVGWNNPENPHHP